MSFFVASKSAYWTATGSRRTRKAPINIQFAHEKRHYLLFGLSGIYRREDLILFSFLYVISKRWTYQIKK